MKTGMASVTFRKKSVNEIIAIAKKTGLDGIEWGGDIHVPAGDIATAQEVAEKCRKSRIGIFSYGSYYRAGAQEQFLPVLHTAAALGADVIRIWGGTLNYAEMPRDEFCRITTRLNEDVRAARAMGIRVALEFHRGTLTETKEGADAILTDVPGLFCYWQPNPDISQEEQLLEIDVIGSRLSNIHVFQWTAGYQAHLLHEGKSEWQARIRRIRACAGLHNMILEFVKDGTEENFMRDAAILREWMK